MNHPTRRQLFKLLAGAAALAVAPALASVAKTIAVADVQGTLLLLDGGHIRVRDFPELAENLLQREKNWLAELRPWNTAVFADYDGCYGRSTYCLDKADIEQMLAEHKPVLSADGATLRFPNAKAGGAKFHGYDLDNNEIWAEYKTYIQARMPENGQGVPIGSQFCVVDNLVVVKKGASA